jgi:hypothetical protein
MMEQALAAGCCLLALLGKCCPATLMIPENFTLHEALQPQLVT